MIDLSNDRGNTVKALLLVLAVALASTASVAAKELPSYDIQLHCKATTAIFGADQNLFLVSCSEAELKSKKQIASRMDVFDEKTFKQCDTMAAAMTAGGSYQSLAGCLALDIANKFLEGKMDIVPAKGSSQPRK